MTDHSAMERAEFARVTGNGRHFADRVRAERQRRGWSQAELSRQMRAVGHPLDQAAISKIESPPDSDRFRRIDIDEAIGFAKVFGLSLEQMTLPMLKARELQALAILANASEIAADFNRAQSRYIKDVIIVALGTQVWPDFATHFEARRSLYPNQLDPLEREFLADVINFLEDDTDNGIGLYKRRGDLEEELALELKHRSWLVPGGFNATQAESDD